MVQIIQTADFIPRSRNEKEWLYNGLDCCVTLEVLHKTLPMLDVHTQATYDFERALQGPILEMMMRGLKVDLVRRKEILTQVKRDIAKVEAQLDRLVRDGIGTSANWRSPAQLKQLFYGTMGFKEVKRPNAKGKWTVTVDREALEKLSQNYRAEPLCSRLLLLRDLDKRRTFLEAPLDKDERFRTNFNITGTDTGRLASRIGDFDTGGNAQNVDRDLREIFVADPGMKFANFDLEQGDSRNVGAICWNLFLESHGEVFAGSYLNACDSSDLHTAVARMVWRGLDWGESPESHRRLADRIFYRQDSYRQIAKKIGHATNFFGQPPTVALKTKTPKQLVQDFQHDYFKAFPCVRERITWVDNKLRQDQTLISLRGRKRIFFGRPEDGTTRRAAYAYDPQSSTADTINQGILNLWRHHNCWFHLQVHDSLLVQYPEEIENEFIPLAIETLRVPLHLAGGREFCIPVEAKVGWTWGDVKKNDKSEVIGNPLGLVKWKGHDNRKR